jgi:hypothetical protein
VPAPPTDLAHFTRDRFVALATEATGLEDFGEASWQEGLDRYLEALATTARLNDVGVGVAGDGVLNDLTNRLRLEQWRRDHPEVARQEVVRPVVVVGQPRTGTSVLHDLLAQDPANRAPLSWEVERPVPAPRSETYRTDPRIAECQAAFDLVESIIPGFTRFHELGALLAQEDVRIFNGDFKSMIYPLQFDVPAYNRWLLHEADLASTYRWHRRFLQHLQSEHAGERWVLKSPVHMWNLPALLAEYPDAVVVQTHRDPLKVIASISALGASLRSMTTDHFDVGSLAAQYREDIVLCLDRAVASRRAGVLPADHVVDLHFADFRKDPLAAVGRLYDTLGMTLTAEAEARMRAFLDAHPGDPDNALRRYSFADTGLDEAELRARVRDYQDYFGVESEPLGT